MTSDTRRGRRYTVVRAIHESVLSVAFRGDWPARLFGRLAAARRVDVVRHELKALPAGSRPLRIAFMSDLHVGPTTPSSTLDAAFAAVEDARPDVLALGGDLVFLAATERRVSELSRRVSAAFAPVKVAVLGNHDLWTDHALIEAGLRGAGVRVLVNDAARLPDPHGAVAIFGIDDPGTGDPDAARAVDACGDATVRIALSHAPEGRPMLAGRGVAVVLCGHTHGGQIALPGRPLYVPGPLGPRYPYGRFDDADPPLIVSRGVGCVTAPFRINAPADVVILDVLACDTPADA